MRRLMALLPILLIAVPGSAEERPDISEVVVDDILDLTAFTVVGMEYRGSVPEEVILLWNEFIPRLPELGIENPDCEAFGMLTGLDVISKEFGYLACVQVEADFEVLPDGMVCLDIPGGKFCRLTFPFEYLDEIYTYAYSVWLPESSWSHGSSYDFEYYPEDFDPGDDSSLMSLYITLE
jgi:predicted transcriptional regulator YdeE